MAKVVITVEDADSENASIKVEWAPEMTHDVDTTLAQGLAMDMLDAVNYLDSLDDTCEDCDGCDGSCECDDPECLCHEDEESEDKEGMN